MSRGAAWCVVVGMDDDADIVAGLRGGDARAFDLAYGRYRARIYGFLLRMTRRQEVAEELLQETFLRLARHATRLDAETRLRVWLFTVARNLWRSWARWSILDAERILEFGASLLGRRDPTPDEVAVAAQAGRALEAELAALPDALREVALLVAQERLDHAEVAEILGITQEAARQRWSRARTRLLAVVEGRDVA